MWPASVACDSRAKGKNIQTVQYPMINRQIAPLENGSVGKRKKARDNLGGKKQRETRRNIGKLGKTGNNMGKQEKKHRKRRRKHRKTKPGKTEGKVEEQGETWKNWKTASPLSSGDMA